jgi:hypothetical protein
MGNIKQNWESYYSDSQISDNWRLPGATNLDAETGVFRHLYLKWSALPQKNSAGDPLDMYQICTDVLTLDTEAQISQGALLFIRRLEVSPGASISLDRSAGAMPFLLVVQEVVDAQTGEKTTLHITTKDQSFPFAIPDGGGLSIIHWKMGEAAPSDYQIDPAYLLEGEPLRLHLRTLFQVATLLSTENPLLSIRQLQWIATLGSVRPETRPMSGQAFAFAASLRGAIDADNNNAMQVPLLDQALYANKAKAFSTLLNLRQAKLDALLDKSGDDTNWLNAAKDAFAVQGTQEELNANLLAKARDTWEQALDARRTVTRQLVGIRISLYEKTELFKVGVDIWKREEITKEVFNIITALLDMASEIPKIVALGPEMAIMPLLKNPANLLKWGQNIIISAVKNRINPPPGPDDGVHLLAALDEGDAGNEQQVQNAIEGDDDEGFQHVDPAAVDKAEVEAKNRDKQLQAAQEKLFSSLKTVVKDGTEIFDAITGIVGIVQKAEAYKKSGGDALDAAINTYNTTMNSYELNGLDVITGGEQNWENLSRSVGKLFDKIPQGINGLGALRAALEQMIYMGRIYSQVQLAVAKANTQLAEMILRKKASLQSVRIYQDRVAKLQDKVVHDQTVSQLVFDTILDTKRSVYLAMDDYRKAFIYFTLDNPDPAELPKITESTDKFADTMARISGNQLALKKAPSSMSPHFTLSDSDLLGELKTKGGFTWTCPTDDSFFSNKSRVRIHDMRVYVEGIQYAGIVSVKIASSGVYADKTGTGDIRRFVGQSQLLTFEYDGNAPFQFSAKNEDGIEAKANIDPRYQDDFFNPTPFTEWTVQVTAQDTGKTLDLSAATAVHVVFFGEFSAG